MRSDGTLEGGDPVRDLYPMTVGQILSFLVQPSKSAQKQPELRGARVPLKGKLFAMLEKLYTTADNDCDIDIIFRPSAAGRQHNPCRQLVVDFLADASLANGRALAARLQSVTTHRSGLGLLFLVSGKNVRAHRLLIARFPADQGVVAHERGHGLDIEFLERVFMKTAHAYKSAIYSGTSFRADFWEGRAIDKQINGPRELSIYWINEFLDSELKATPAAGTKRLAIAMREAIRDAENSDVRDELVSATRLVRGHDGRHLSPATLVASLGLTDKAQEALREALPRPELFDQTFRLDAEEFNRHILYRAVELDNGAVLVADNARFDAIFERDDVRGADRVRYSTEGRVVDQRLRKTR